MEAGQSPKHIGIVACTAEGASLCYRTICAEGPELLGRHGHPEVSLHNLSLDRYVEYLDDGDVEKVGDLMLESAEKLSRAGADFLICPDNTIHLAFDHVEPRSPLPWLHIAEVVATRAREAGYQTLGLTGTHWLVNSDVYPSRIENAGLNLVRPDSPVRQEMGRIIMEELVYGEFKPQSIEYFRSVISELRDRGCDAVILGCTEIPLIIDDSNSPLPTLDSTRLLARAALRRACS
jgi:aspartate racemase